MMKKTYYFNFFPTKAEEQAAMARGKPYEVTKTLIEIREFNDSPPPQQQFDKRNPWQIRKVVTANDVLTGKLPLSHNEIFDYVFRNWALDLCKYVIKGMPVSVIIADYTDEENPKRFQSENIFIQGSNDNYVLSCVDVVKSRRLQPGDEIGLFWDVNSAIFGFKLLNRENSSKP